jgi:hypothetical protein
LIQIKTDCRAGLVNTAADIALMKLTICRR